MLDNFTYNFLKYNKPESAENMLKYCLENKLYNIAEILSELFSKRFLHNKRILQLCAQSFDVSNNTEKALNTYQSILKHNLNSQESENINFKISKYTPEIYDKYIDYPQQIITQINNKKKSEFPLITFTITTCKRFHLFEKTMNSFLNCCSDIHLIDRWICVDDNSSEEDRQKMINLYPFFEFIFKNKQDKGHPKSMNIIRNIVKTPYIFHMEDDWKFFIKRKYLSHCIEVLRAHNQIGQCLINKNYAETHNDIDIKGGIFNCIHPNIRFYCHEYYPPENIKTFYEKHGENAKQCAYWPHFSFRPSLLKSSMLQEIGSFNENANHFEMEYSYRYINKSYVSAFLEGIYCLHTGRLTSERNDTSKQNAYTLNNESQFTGKKKHIDNLKTIVINLESRKDRIKTFDKICPIHYYKFKAINGKSLKPNEQLQRIFEGNDYNMRSGMVGCAMSHIKLYIELLKSDYNKFLILEDDVTFSPNFEKNLENIIQFNENDLDMIYLGHHLYPQYKTKEIYEYKDNIQLHMLSKDLSLKFSMGGTFSYIITKNGVRKALEFINKNGMTNGIDTVLQKAIGFIKSAYCYPHIVFSDCVIDTNVDSNIQKDFTSVSLEKNIQNIEKYPKRLCKNEEYNIDDALIYK